MSNIIDKYIPEKSIPYVKKLLEDNSIKIIICQPRKTKLGDFRVRNNQPIIKINNDLNIFSFLITTIHEIAHYYVWKDYQFNIKPHGKEWQLTFAYLLRPLIIKNIFPEEISRALKKQITSKITASSCTDKNLYKILRKYDSDDKGKIFIEDLLPKTRFLFEKNIYELIKKRRSRYECKREDGKLFLFSSIAQVEIIRFFIFLPYFLI